jgi:hypothetical protein
MKKYLYILSLISITFFSCEDVVDVDLETAQERLVIEAMIKWEQETIGNEQIIKLTKTSSFYNNQLIHATGATVIVTNIDTSQVFNFIETEDGIYATDSFEPILNNKYQLEVIYNDEVYKATETLFEAPEIIEITQSTEEGFSTEDPEIVLSFQDFLDQDDFYRISFIQTRGDDVLEDERYTYDSRFESNNVLSDFFESDTFKVGDQFIISVTKVSKQFYNFINVLEEQEDSGFGPFSSPPVNVKGNCINTTNESHYPYGYFGLNQISTEVYTFE